jgi:hypothetical protein
MSGDSLYVLRLVSISVCSFVVLPAFLLVNFPSYTPHGISLAFFGTFLVVFMLPGVLIVQILSIRCSLGTSLP